ncbi:protein of unknown function [Pseudomonas sp. JV551A1]|nr:protein of unknown function [Pseudomonas sp. JV551A1]
MGAALAANTGAAGAMHRVGFFAAKAAPTGYGDRLRVQFSVRQRSPKGCAISHRYCAASKLCAIPVGAGKPAKRPLKAHWFLWMVRPASAGLPPSR